MVLQSVHRLFFLFARDIDEVQQQPCAFDMAKKLKAQPVPFRRSLDQPRDICYDNCRMIIIANNAEQRLERGEGIGRDLRLGGGDAGKEGRFAGIRQPDEAHVGEQLELRDSIPVLVLLHRPERTREPER